jgi:hypothetical protein
MSTEEMTDHQHGQDEQGDTRKDGVKVDGGRLVDDTI